MSDSEDDFMSDKFLSGAEEIKPGLAKTNHQRRIIKIEAERAEMEAERLRLKQKKNPVHAEIERREEVLAKPLSEDSNSKGFALMAKMGFKPGMSLGKKKDEHDLGSGIREPIPVVVRGHRGGLGVESAEVEKIKNEKEGARKRIHAQMERMKERARMADDLSDDYRKRARMAAIHKQIVGDIIRSRKACHELDMRKELDLPEEPWFWPSYKERKMDDGTGVGTSRAGIPFGKAMPEDDEEDEVRYHYSNGQDAPKEERIDEMTDDVLIERLESITLYLRTAHHYCVWCGCAYTDADDIESGCPGPARDCHDDGDE